jgi:hypothetical protein
MWSGHPAVFAAKSNSHETTYINPVIFGKGSIFQDVMLSSVSRFIYLSGIYIASIFRVNEESKQAANRI